MFRTSRTPRVVLLLAPAIAVLVFAVYVGYASFVEYRRSVSDAYARAETAAQIVAGYATQVFANVEQTLQGLSADVTAADIGEPAARIRIHEALRARQASSSATFAFFIVDADGMLRHTSRTLTPAPADFSEAEEFLAFRNEPDTELVFAAPRLGRVGFASGEWVATVARPIRDAAGAFAGYFGVSVSVRELGELFQSIDIGPGGVIGLIRDDGRMMLRRPYDEDILSRGLPAQAVLAAWERLGQRGRFDARFRTDGVERLAAIEALPRFGLIAYAGLPKNEVEASWRTASMWLVLPGAALAILALAIGYAGVRTVERGRAREQAVSARLELLAVHSTSLAKIADIEALMAEVAKVSRELVPAHQSVASRTAGDDFAQVIANVSLSEKYAAWRDYAAPPDGSGIYAIVCRENRAMRLTQAELEAHPAWRGFGDARGDHPPMNGWLAVPMVAQGGRNLGLIQLSDRTEGDFDRDDEAIIVQLAQLVAALVEAVEARDEIEQALAQSREARGAAERATVAARVAMARAEEAQRDEHEERARIENILTSMPDGFASLDRDWRFTYLNPAAVRLVAPRNLDYRDMMGGNIWEIFPGLVGTIAEESYRRVMSERQPDRFRFHAKMIGQWVDVTAFPSQDGISIFLRPVTDLVETEERLRQAQKMEAVGQLTGGVAHDFNNLLTVIIGNGEILAGTLADKPREQRLSSLILSAAERGADLTQRLLAFSRRQPLDPRATDIGGLLGDVESLLQRTLGEAVDLRTVVTPDLWPAQIDPNQLENAIINLAINGRDAMPDGGRLTIETANVVIDRSYAEGHLEVKPGRYVLIAVSDTGSGMAPEVLERAFEPFFTTKETGRGSGLGLSMIYGFVKQSGGHIKLYSEVGHGTTVKLYLPRAAAEPDVEIAFVGDGPLSGNERVLVVEDDPGVRGFVVETLEANGYRVAAESTGVAALARLERDNAFDLLFTDVVLPGGVNGRQLSDRAAVLKPGLKVLFTSGYTENAIIHHGRLDAGVQLLSKPFRALDLLLKLRRVIEG